MDKYLDNKTKKNIWEIFTGYKERRDMAIKNAGFEQEEYKEKASQIRGKAFEKFEENLKTAITQLEAKCFRVHQAGNSQEAREIIRQLVSGAKTVAKAKTNTGREINIDQALEDVESFETDLGDFIMELFKKEDQHYVLPAIHMTANQVSEKIKEKYGDEVESDAEKLTHYLCEKIREKIMKAEVGITGANFFTETGEVVLLENEGNISLLSRLPEKHIVVCGIDKLVKSSEDAITLCKTAAIFGTGQDITKYISVISGPSATADIENQLVLGAQGAKEVHLVLLDNGRRQMMEKGFGDLLKCINCGACINFCPVYHQIGSRYGSGKYIGSKGIVSSAFEQSPKKLEDAKNAGSFKCTLCGSCRENCPMKIDLPEMVRAIRKMQNDAKLQTSQNKQMLEKIKSHGNPFGEIAEGEIPDKLFCC